MPPLHSNSNVIVPTDQAENLSLYEQCLRGELDGFQLYEHSVVGELNSRSIRAIVAFTPVDADPSQIVPALIEDGVTPGPLMGWALDPTKSRHAYGYGADIGSSRQELRNALIEANRIAPNRRAVVADKIRRIIGKPIKYDLWRRF